MTLAYLSPHQFYERKSLWAGNESLLPAETKPVNWKQNFTLTLVMSYPLLTERSVAWKMDKENLHKLERAQIIATMWMLCNETTISYKDCLIKMKFLPLSIYLEIHNLLLSLTGTTTAFIWRYQGLPITKLDNKTAGWHRHILRPTTNILINFCKR